MSTLIISAKSQTAQNEYYPPAGKKWVVLSAYIKLIAGAGAGTRNMYFWIKRSDGTGSWYDAEQLSEIANKTTASTSYESGFGSVVALYTQSDAPVQATQPVVMNHADRLVIDGTLITDDVMDFMIEVDEVIDE